MQTDDLDIDEILESGDPEAMSALLEKLDDDLEFSTENKADEVGDELAAGETSSAEGEEGEVTKDDVKAEPEVEATPDVDEAQTDDERYIESKNGQHKIPYSVLEQVRQRAADAEKELQYLHDRQAKQERQLQALTQQLEENGLDPEELPEDFKLTDELKAQILEDHGPVGKAMVAMYEQLAMTRTQIANNPATPSTSTSVDDPVEAAILENDSLKEWRDGYTNGESPELWEYAVAMDKQLRTDPVWRNKSLDERFAEAVRRTESTFHITSKAPSNSQHKIDTAIKKAEETAQPPASLSDLGNGETSPEKSLTDQLLEMDVDDQLAALEKMSEAQRDQVLAALDF